MSRKLTDWLAAYREFTEDWEPPEAFNTWCALVVLSTATRRGVWLEEAKMQLWPNLFVVLVGPSGCGKTSAMRAATPFIEHLKEAYGVGISPAKVTMRKLWTRLEESSIPVEGVGMITPYVIWVEEFPSFLGSDAYRSGMLADLTTIYDCPKILEKETQTAGDVSIERPYVTMGAGATASGLFDVLPPGSVAQGFTARLIFVAGDYPDKVLERKWETKHEKLSLALMHDLDVIAKLRGPMQMSDVAKALWADFYMNRPDPDEEYADARLQGYASRRPLYVKKLGMLLSLSEGDTMLVEAHHLELALQLLGQVDRSLVKIYGEIAPKVTINAYPKMLRVLRKSKDHRLSHSELFRRFSYILDAREFEATLQAMEGMGLIASEVDAGDVGRAWQRRKFYKMTKEGGHWLSDR